MRGLEVDTAVLDALPENQRREAQELLAKLAEANERNPLLNYFPHVKQRAFHGSQKRIKAFFGGNRSGKTTAGIADDLIQAVDVNCLPDHLRKYKRWEPPFKCRIVSPDFTSTMEGVIFEKLRELAPKDQLDGGSWEKAYDKQRRVLRFANGSWFDFLTSEQDIDKFSGAALHRVHFDEEPPGEKGRQIYQECSMRLIDYGGDVLFSMTPLFGMSWVYDVVWEKRGPEITNGVYASDGLTVVTVDMDENPHLNEEAKQIVLDGLTDAEKKARKQGQFVHFAGLVYPEFDPDTHVVNPIPKDFLKGQIVYLVIDPGLKTTAILFAAFDADNDLLVFDEIGLSDNLAVPEEATKAIKAKAKEWGVKPTYSIIDPAARIRSLVNAEQVQSAYARAGLNTIAGQNAVEPGVFEVKRRLEHTLKDGAGQLKVTRNCQRLIDEFSRYRIDPKADGFAVVKEHDHFLDALRYLCMSRPIAPQTLPKPRSKHVRWEYGKAPAFDQEERYEPTHPFGEAY